MPHTHKKRNSQTESREVLITKNVRIIAEAFILAIEDGYMTYRDFKRIQEILDNKYWKPSWVPEKEIK